MLTQLYAKTAENAPAGARVRRTARRRRPIRRPTGNNYYYYYFRGGPGDESRAVRYVSKYDKNGCIFIVAVVQIKRPAVLYTVQGVYGVHTISSAGLLYNYFLRLPPVRWPGPGPEYSCRTVDNNRQSRRPPPDRPAPVRQHDRGRSRGPRSRGFTPPPSRVFAKRPTNN